jgi:excisionase family DNA binding protein
VAEVADALNVSTKTVRRLIHARDLVSIRIGRQVRVSEEDLATYVRHNRS